MRTHLYVLVAALLFSFPSFAEIREDASHTHMSLLLSDSLYDNRLAARALLQSPDQELLDVLAEQVYRHASQPIDDVGVNNYIKMFRFLSTSGGARYRTVLQDSAALYEQSSSARKEKGRVVIKIKSGFKTAINDLKQDTATQFVPGTVSFDDVRVRLEAIKQINKQAFLGKPKVTPESGQDMATVYSSIGLPDEVTSLTLPTDIAKRVGIHAYYYGIGIVQFLYIKDGWRVDRVMTEASNVLPTYQGANAQLAHALASANEKYLYYLVKPAWPVIQQDSALFAPLASNVLRLKDTKEKLGVGAVIFVLRRLSNNNPEHVALLKTLVTSAGNKDIAKRAYSTLNSGPLFDEKEDAENEDEQNEEAE